MPWTRTWLIALVLFIALFGAACGGVSGEPSEPGEALALLEDEFASIDGATVDLAQLQGQDVVLWFWAPW